MFHSRTRLIVGVLVIVIGLCVWVQSSTSAQTRQIIFNGGPRVKITSNNSESRFEQVAKVDVRDLMVDIVREGDNYYWASREDIPMVAMDDPVYTTYVAVTGAGYVKVLKPEMKRVAGLMDPTAEEFDYVEHLILGLNSVTYYGVCIYRTAGGASASCEIDQ